MKGDDLDRMLGDDALEPSSGFAMRVMDAVYASAAEPPPLRFPWGRLALGVVACLAFSASATLLAPQASAVFGPALAPLIGVGPLLGRATVVLASALVLSRLPRLFVRS